jgi:tripartite-type tricarboxylate transporter receptor subunit TctC
VIKRFPAGAALAIASASAFAATAPYPDKPIRLLTAEIGGGSDFAARLIGQAVAANVGQQVVVDNRVGGVILGDIAAKATPDGYNILLYSGTLWLLPLMRDKVPYDAFRDFAPITLMGASPMVLVVHPTVPVNTVKELIALAKAKPGGLNCATGPIGATPYLAAELFKSMAGVDMATVAYKGVGAAVTDLIGGRVQVMFPNTGAAMPHVKSGRLKGIAVTSAHPSSLVPGMPTVAASGVPAYEAVALYGIFAPAKTPPAIVRRLTREFVAVLGTADIKDKLLGAGIEVIGGTPEQLTATMKSEVARMGRILKGAGVQKD